MQVRGLAAGAVVVMCAVAQGARAQAAETLEQRVTRLEGIVAAQARLLDEQAQRLRGANDLAEMRARGVASDAPLRAAPAPQQAAAPGAPQAPRAQATPSVAVGQPPPQRPRVEFDALPEQASVLTPKGRLVLEPAMDYTHASTNRLVFRGVEIVTGIQIGVIEASDADRNALGLSLAGRYGLTRRLELQANLPYVRRSDRVTTLAQRDETISRTIDLDGRGLGDVEIGARYQVNRIRADRPIFIAGLRVKSDTGSSPFEIGRDEFGVATRLATGSGFWGVEPSLSVLYASDPVAIFAGVSYLYHMPKDINRQVGDVLIGRVDPGDSIGFNAGFGFAVNPRFSFSMGYRHNYILPTRSVVGGTRQKSESLQVGSFTFGWSLRLNDRMTLNNNYEFGATSDAPDARIVVRIPYRF